MTQFAEDFRIDQTDYQPNVQHRKAGRALPILYYAGHWAHLHCLLTLHSRWVLLLLLLLWFDFCCMILFMIFVCTPLFWAIVTACALTLDPNHLQNRTFFDYYSLFSLTHGRRMYCSHVTILYPSSNSLLDRMLNGRVASPDRNSMCETCGLIISFVNAP